MNGEGKRSARRNNKKSLIKITNQKSSVSYLPSSLILEILIKLPFKSVCRSRCVCKTWKSLISNKNFSNLYSKNLPFTLLLSFDYYSLDFVEIGLNGTISYTETNLPKNLRTHGFTLVSSSNGLLCLRGHNYRDDNIYIMNPIFGDILMLPRLHNENGFVSRAYGFGFCTQSDHYKVLIIYCKERRGWSRRSGNIFFKILTMGIDHEWRSLQDSSLTFDFSYYESFITHEGVVYFVCANYSNGIDRYIIFSFDLEKEKGSLIPFPSDLTEHAHLWLCDGNLCLTTDADKDGDLIVTWTMKQCGSWSKSILEKPCSILGGPITKLRNGDLLMQDEEDSLIFYDEKKMMIRRVIETPRRLRLFGYVPNFLPLGTGDLGQTYCESLNTTNALDILEKSETLSNTCLKKDAFNFIVRNMKDMAFSERFEAFVDRNPLRFLEITRALLSETNHALPALESESSPSPQHELNNTSSDLDNKISISFGSLNQPVFVSKGF